MIRTDEALDLFRRLKPQFGEKMDRLWVAYSLGNRKEREEIVEILRMLDAAHLRKTPDDKTINLPPPPPEVSKGKFHLGTVIYNGQPLHEFSLPDTTAIRGHIGIFGRTGGGKSNLIFHLLEALGKEGVPSWVFDWKREGRALLSRNAPGRKPVVFTVGRPLAPFQFNPLFPPPGSEEEIQSFHERLIDVIARAFFVGAGVKSLLRKGLAAITAKWRENPDENPLDFKVLLHWVLNHRPQQAVRGKRSADWTESTIRVLESLSLGRFGQGLNTQEGIDLSALMARDVVFELDALADDQKAFIIESLLLWLRQYLLSRSEDADKDRLKLVLVIEEAHHVLKTGREESLSESVLEVTLRETRSLGMGLVLVDQTPSLINQVAFSNTFTSIFFSLKGRQDIRAAAGALLLSRDQEESLGRLPVGTAIVKLQDRWFDPFLIQVPHVPDKDLPVRDEEVRSHYQAIRGDFKRLAAPSGSFRAPLEDSDAITPAPIPERDTESLTTQDVELLKGILADPLVGISQRYKRMGVSTRHGNESKERLLKSGFIRVADVTTPTGRLKLLELTLQGEHYLRDRHLLATPVPRNGAAHRYWKNRIADHFRRLGYQVTIEKVVVNGKRVDVEAVKGDERIAIEVETGQSKSTSDFPLVLLHYPKLIILATDPIAQAKVQRALEQLPEDVRQRITCWTPTNIGQAGELDLTWVSKRNVETLSRRTGG